MSESSPVNLPESQPGLMTKPYASTNCRHHRASSTREIHVFVVEKILTNKKNISQVLSPHFQPSSSSSSSSNPPALVKLLPPPFTRSLHPYHSHHQTTSTTPPWALLVAMLAPVLWTLATHHCPNHEQSNVANLGRSPQDQADSDGCVGF